MAMAHTPAKVPTFALLTCLLPFMVTKGSRVLEKMVMKHMYMYRKLWSATLISLDYQNINFLCGCYHWVNSLTTYTCSSVRCFYQGIEVWFNIIYATRTLSLRTFMDEGALCFFFFFYFMFSNVPSFLFFTESGLEFLRRLPQFISMRRMVQQNPQSLPVLLQQLGQENPELLGVQ